MHELTTIISEGDIEIQHSKNKLVVVDNGKARAWQYSDGTFQKPFGGVIPTAKIPTNVIELCGKAAKIVKESYASKKAEMFPNFQSLEYHEKLIAKYDIMEALGYISPSDANIERSGIHASYGKVMSEVERERFDNE